MQRRSFWVRDNKWKARQLKRNEDAEIERKARKQEEARDVRPMACDKPVDKKS